MTAPKLFLNLYFMACLPLAAFLAALKLGYEVVDLSWLVSFVLALLYAAASLALFPRAVPPLPWGQALHLAARVTGTLALIPAVSVAAFLITDRMEGVPSLIVLAGAALGMTLFAAFYLREGGDGGLAPVVERVHRGRRRGGTAEYAQRLRDEEDRRDVA